MAYCGCTFFAVFLHLEHETSSFGVWNGPVTLWIPLIMCVFSVLCHFQSFCHFSTHRGKCLSFVRISLLLLLYSLLFIIIFIFDCYGSMYEFVFYFLYFYFSFLLLILCVRVSISLCSDHWFLLDFSSFLLFSGVLFFLTRFLQWIRCLKGVLRSFLEEMTSKRGEGLKRTPE